MASYGADCVLSVDPIRKAIMDFVTARKPFPLPWPLARRLDRASRTLLEVDGEPPPDFSQPRGEPAFSSPSSVSWRVFKNPVSLFIGGVAAVILELSEPSVRTGVWEHSGFRLDPVRRLRRTGLAAMVTVYGARSVAETMIARVRRMHDRVRGLTPSGVAYSANDPELLNWVHVTASFGFLQAYHTYAEPLSAAARDRYYQESAGTAALYGVTRVSSSEAEAFALMEAMRGRLEPSQILFEFLDIMRKTPVLPSLFRVAQPALVSAAVSLTPAWVRQTIGLPHAFCLKKWESSLVRRAGQAADRIVLTSSPPVQSCLRLGLPPDFLYRAQIDR
jgi:uncharacterized protein (DUF2236 family)